MIQGPSTTGIKGPPDVEEGQPVEVEIGVEGVDHILVSDGRPGSKPEKIPVGPGGKTTIPPQPGWTAGTILFIYTNTTPVRGILIEVVPPHL